MSEAEEEGPLSFEELVDLALSFLQEELRAERCLVVHPDQLQTEPMVQAHVGFGPHAADELDMIRWEWMTRNQPFLVEWEAGRSVLGCPLTLPGRPPFGLLYADHSRARFQNLHMDALLSFSERYQEALEELVDLEATPDPPAPVPEPVTGPNFGPFDIPEDEADPGVDWALLVVDWI